jgi:hypothetical protein
VLLRGVTGCPSPVTATFAVQQVVSWFTTQRALKIYTPEGAYANTTLLLFPLLINVCTHLALTVRPCSPSLTPTAT